MFPSLPTVIWVAQWVLVVFDVVLRYGYHVPYHSTITSIINTTIDFWVLSVIQQWVYALTHRFRFCTGLLSYSQFLQASVHLVLCSLWRPVFLWMQILQVLSTKPATTVYWHKWSKISPIWCLCVSSHLEPQQNLSQACYPEASDLALFHHS